MEAFAEHLCEHCDLIRVGPVARKMYDDYEYAVVAVKHPEDGTVEIKGLVAPLLPWWCFWRRPFSWEHVAAMLPLAKASGLKPRFERAKNSEKEIQ